MTNKILLFNPFYVWDFHFFTDLEIIKNHVDRGDLVTVLTCDIDLLYCELDLEHNLLLGQQCISRRNEAFKLFDTLFNWDKQVNFLNLVNLSASDQKIISNFPKYPKTLRELKSLSIGNFDLGLSVVSSLISSLREPYPHPVRHQDLVSKTIESALIIYLSMQNHIREHQPDKIYVFNGRFAVVRPAVRAAQLFNIDFCTHERAGVMGKYSLTHNTYPHDLEYQKLKLISTWNNSDLLDWKKITIGSQWFLDRRLSKDQGWFSFTKDQHKLPEFVNRSKFIVVIFNSSQDEYEGIKEWQYDVYQSQNQAIFKLAYDLQNQPDIDIYLRIHPNLKGINNSQTKALQRLRGRYQNFHVIDAEDPTNSYELLDLANVVITFGSTMGVEAAFYGKPSILAGRALYEELEVSMSIKSHGELVNLIKEKQFNLTDELRDKNRRNAIKYGFYMATDGIDFQYFKQQGVNDLILSPKVVQSEGFKKYVGNNLKESLHLRDTNLIIFPDPKQSEQCIYEELVRVITSLENHPDCGKITLLVNAGKFPPHLTQAFTEQLCEEEEEGLQISVVGKLSPLEWAALLPQVTGRIVLAQEDGESVGQLPMDQVPLVAVDG